MKAVGVLCRPRGGDCDRDGVGRELVAAGSGRPGTPARRAVLCRQVRAEEPGGSSPGLVRQGATTERFGILRAGVVRSIALKQKCRPWENRRLGLKGLQGPAGPAGERGAQPGLLGQPVLLGRVEESPARRGPPVPRARLVPPERRATPERPALPALPERLGLPGLLALSGRRGRSGRRDCRARASVTTPPSSASPTGTTSSTAARPGISVTPATTSCSRSSSSETLRRKEAT